LLLWRLGTFEEATHITTARIQKYFLDWSTKFLAY
jgi:hypothetical protein